MSRSEPPSGREVRAPQADGSAPPGSERASAGEQPEELFRYSVSVAWSGDALGCGEVKTRSAGIAIPIGGAVELGGCGKGANPEELLLAAIGACFINTWVIFLKKLGLVYAEPSLRVSGNLEKDPAGGYRMRDATVHARVPSELFGEKEKEVRKTLQLAEKYCIISKAVRMAMPLTIEVETV
jgi:organic hydroperoxide reductase OsmC/OhrA